MTSRAATANNIVRRAMVAVIDVVCFGCTAAGLYWWEGPLAASGHVDPHVIGDPWHPHMMLCVTDHKRKVNQKSQRQSLQGQQTCRAMRVLSSTHDSAIFGQGAKLLKNGTAMLPLLHD